MVCPKLEKGTCKVNDKKCSKKYEIKMQKYQTCSLIKNGKKCKTIKKKLAKSKSVAKKPKKKKVAVKKKSFLRRFLFK